MIKTAVVTGPTGVVGTALLRKLLEKEIKIYAVCRPDSKRVFQIPSHPLLHLVLCNFKDISNLPNLISEKCDAFFHLAWLGTVDPINRFNMQLQTDNIKYTLDAVIAAKELGCQVFVGTGSQAEYGHVQGIIHPYMETNPVSGYGMAKLCAGQMTRVMCKDLGIKHIWTRIVSTYGKYDGKNTLIRWTIDNLLSGKKPSLTKCEQIWDYLYSLDAAEGLIAMADKGIDGSIYVLGSGQTKTLREYVEIIRNEIDPELELGFGEKEYYADQAMHLEADIDNLTRDTGWKPQYTFEQGIAELLKESKFELGIGVNK